MKKKIAVSTGFDAKRSATRMISVYSLSIGIYLCLLRLLGNVPYQIILLYLLGGFAPRTIQGIIEKRFGILASKSSGYLTDMVGRLSIVRIGSYITFLLSFIMTAFSITSDRPMGQYDIILILVSLSFIPKVASKYVEEKRLADSGK